MGTFFSVSSFLFKTKISELSKACFGYAHSELVLEDLLSDEFVLTLPDSLLYFLAKSSVFYLLNLNSGSEGFLGTYFPGFVEACHFFTFSDYLVALTFPAWILPMNAGYSPLLDFSEIGSLQKYSYFWFSLNKLVPIGVLNPFSYRPLPYLRLLSDKTL